MATPLDIGLIEHFRVIFPFLLTLIVVYGVLNSVNLFKNNTMNALIAFILAVAVLLSPVVRETLNRSAPWIVLLLFFIFFALLSYMALGASGDDITNVLKSANYRFINFWVITIIIIIVVGSLTSTVSERGGIGRDVESTNETASPSDESVASADQESAFWDTLFHPKVLGLVFLLLVAMFTVQRLVRSD